MSREDAVIRAAIKRGLSGAQALDLLDLVEGGKQKKAPDARVVDARAEVEEAK